MATIVVGIIVFGLIGLSVYFSFRKPKNGGCRGCAHCPSEQIEQSSEEQQHCSSCHPSNSAK